MHFGCEVLLKMESLNFVVFADEALLSVILKTINKNEYDTMNKTTLDDIEKFVKVLLVCAFNEKHHHFFGSFRMDSYSSSNPLQSLVGLQNSNTF